jgi:hypothetical protein
MLHRTLARAMLAGLFLVPVVAAAPPDDLGSYAKWEKIEIALTGPLSTASGHPNPFAVAVDGVFTAPSGKTTVVPGFYDGDGRRGQDGNVWKLRFSADETGGWSFRTRSDHSALDGRTGSFTVTAAPDGSPDFYRWGRLEAIGTAENKIRYLKFRDGPYWLKAGCDDPENFLGNYTNYDTTEKRAAAIDYLAERGINSLHIMSHNIDGDDKDVWPWLGKTSREARSNSTGEVRFDVAKLDEWRELFEHMQQHMQQRGVVLYLVLEDDSAWKGYDHMRYYREMVARFGYLPGLLFNLGEEHNENYKLAEALAFMQQLAELDPYDHPRGIHNVNSPQNDYIDAPQIDFTSIQTGSPGTRRGLDNALQHNQIAIDWLRRCDARGRRHLLINLKADPNSSGPRGGRLTWPAACGRLTCWSPTTARCRPGNRRGTSWAGRGDSWKRCHSGKCSPIMTWCNRARPCVSRNPAERMHCTCRRGAASRWNWPRAAATRCPGGTRPTDTTTSFKTKRTSAVVFICTPDDGRRSWLTVQEGPKGPKGLKGRKGRNGRTDSHWEDGRVRADVSPGMACRTLAGAARAAEPQNPGTKDVIRD